jgi:hypothetical protein
MRVQARSITLCAFDRPFALSRAQAASFASIRPSPALTPSDQVPLSIRHYRLTSQYLGNLQEGGCDSLSLDLDELDHRAIGKAVVERAGRLIEIVGDTTRTISARRTALRELRLLASLSPSLQRMTVACELGSQLRLPRITRQSPN